MTRKRALRAGGALSACTLKHALKERDLEKPSF